MANSNGKMMIHRPSIGFGRIQLPGRRLATIGFVAEQYVQFPGRDAGNDVFNRPIKWNRTLDPIGLLRQPFIAMNAPELSLVKIEPPEASIRDVAPCD